MHWLYLIASGNDDGVYKIGITVDVDQRLEQIKSQYEVPDAFLVEAMDVSSRGEVFALEKALHERFDSKRAKSYLGREWFSLSKADISSLQAMYQTESDSFAQATAFFGIVEEVAKLKPKAERQEADRQSKITFNRRYGKTHDTKPNALLARYKRLQDRMLNGILGDRFAFKTYRHPALDLRDKAAKEVEKAAQKELKPLWYQAGFIGFAGGALICAASGNVGATVPAAMGGGILGLMGGGLTAASKPQEEKEKSRVAFDVHITGYYPKCHDQTLSAVIDHVEKQSYLVSGLAEDIRKLRNQPARMPRIELPTLDKLKKEHCSQTFWPKALATVMGGYFLMLGIGTVSELERQERQQNTSYINIPHLAGFSNA